MGTFLILAVVLTSALAGYLLGAWGPDLLAASRDMAHARTQQGREFPPPPPPQAFLVRQDPRQDADPDGA